MDVKVLLKCATTISIWGISSYYGNVQEKLRIKYITNENNENNNYNRKSKFCNETRMPYGWMVLATYFVWISD
jgi:hypothetical protein